MYSPQVRLHREIAKAGIPIDGVSGERDDLRIDFRDEATQEQQSEAQSIAASFDWAPRQARELSAIEADVLEVDEVSFKKLVARLIAKQIKADPDFAEELGIRIPGEERVQ